MNYNVIYKTVLILTALSQTTIWAESTKEIKIDENLTWTEPEAYTTAGDWAMWAEPNTNGTFTYKSTNGTLTFTGNYVFIGAPNRSFQNNTLTSNFTGTGDTIKLASNQSILIGYVDTGNTGNNFSVNISSADKSAKNTLLADNIQVFGGLNYDASDASTTTSTMSFNGNTILKSANGESSTNITLNPSSNPVFYGLWNGYNGGTSKLIVSGSNNELNINNLNINNTKDSSVTYNNSPKSILEVSNSANTINANTANINLSKAQASSLVKIAAGNTFKVSSGFEANMQSGLDFKSVYNSTTQELSDGTLFVFESSSDEFGYVTTSKIEVDSANGILNAFVVLDLTSSISYLDKENQQMAELFTGINKFGDDCDFFIKINSTIVGVGETYNGFTFDSVDKVGGSLIYNFTVPEPSTYALIFGFIGLGIAFLRKKSK